MTDGHDIHTYTARRVSVGAVQSHSTTSRIKRERGGFVLAPARPADCARGQAATYHGIALLDRCWSYFFFWV